MVVIRKMWEQIINRLDVNCECMAYSLKCVAAAVRLSKRIHNSGGYKEWPLVFVWAKLGVWRFKREWMYGTPHFKARIAMEQAPSSSTTPVKWVEKCFRIGNFSDRTHIIPTLHKHTSSLHTNVCVAISQPILIVHRAFVWNFSPFSLLRCWCDFHCLDFVFIKVRINRSLISVCPM